MHRAAQILEAVARQPGTMRLGDLSDLLQAPKSSVHALLKGLLGIGYLRKSGEAYHLGPALAALIAPNRLSIPDLVLPLLERLRDETGETSTLGLFAGDSVVYARSAASTASVRYVPEVGVRRPLHPTSIGKLLLASWPEDRAKAYLDQIAVPALQSVLTSLRAVRSEGRAFNRGETLTDVTAVARPLLVDGEQIGGISVAGPTGRIEPHLERIDELLSTGLRELQLDLLAAAKG